MMDARSTFIAPILLIFGVGLQGVLAEGSKFTCYQCTYDVRRTENWNRPECINDTNSLGKIWLRDCEADQFCTFQQVYDIGEKRITNYDRRCSATSLGNKCTPDWSHVMCFSSCQEDYCNGEEMIDGLKQYLQNSATDIKAKTWLLLILPIMLGVYSSTV